MTLNEKLAYLAGLFDGEGCIGLYNTRTKKDSRNVNYQLIMRVTQKSPLAVELFMELFGGQIYAYKDVGPNKPGPYFSWRVTDKKAVAALVQLQPYLREKLEQCKTALAFQELRYKQRCRKVGTRLSDAELAERESYVVKLKQQKHVDWPLDHFTAREV